MSDKKMTLDEFLLKAELHRQELREQMDKVYREVSGGLTAAEDFSLFQRQVAAKEEEMRRNGWRETR